MKKKHDILVLNKGYIPIHIVSWKTGLSLIFQEKCRAIDREFMAYPFEDWKEFSVKAKDYVTVDTVSYPVAIPEIIVSVTFNRLPDRKVKYSRQTVFQRDDFKCVYCKQKFDKKLLTLDHIVPKTDGGRTTWNNIVTACFGCNQKKGHKTCEEVGFKTPTPQKPRWVSPLANVTKAPCVSWEHFMPRVTTKEDE